MNQREAFEKWAKQMCCTGTREKINFSRVKYDEAELYEDKSVEVAWAAWQAATENQWQSIDTAPLDGTPVLAVVQGFQPTVAEFQNGFWIYYDEQCTSDSEYNPTHWMPLPPAP